MEDISLRCSRLVAVHDFFTRLYSHVDDVDGKRMKLFGNHLWAIKVIVSRLVCHTVDSQIVSSLTVVSRNCSEKA